MNERQTVIITGASRGLGASAAQIAAVSFNANVVLAARSADALQTVAAVITAAGGAALAVPADVSRVEDCEMLVQSALERFGRIDGLVNNAGVIEPIHRMRAADPQAWQRSWATNVLGPLMLTRFALPELAKNSGRVVNISSGAASNVIGGWGAYSASKAAMDHLTRILASEEPQVTPVAFRPGIVDTEMQATIRATGQGEMSTEDYNRLNGMHEKGRLLPVDVPGRIIACLALFAPKEWSGQVLAWNDEPVKEWAKGF